MSFVSRVFRTALVSTCFITAQSAVQAASNWYFNPTGTGLAEASLVSSLNIGGFGFIEQSISSTHFLALDFDEHGAYQVLDASGSAPYSAHDITVSYHIGGYLGLFGSDFTHGTIDIYSDSTFDFGSTNGSFGADNGTLIAQFEVSTGGINPFSRQAFLQADLVSGSMATGYFFDSNGVDAAGRAGISFSLGVQNETIDPSGTHIVPEIACEQAGFDGPGCNGSQYQPAFFDIAYSTVHDTGVATLDIPTLDARLVSAVPEPASALLLLTGLAVIGAARHVRAG